MRRMYCDLVSTERVSFTHGDVSNSGQKSDDPRSHSSAQGRLAFVTTSALGKRRNIASAVVSATKISGDLFWQECSPPTDTGSGIVDHSRRKVVERGWRSSRVSSVKERE